MTEEEKQYEVAKRHRMLAWVLLWNLVVYLMGLGPWRALMLLPSQILPSLTETGELLAEWVPIIVSVALFPVQLWAMYMLGKSLGMKYSLFTWLLGFVVCIFYFPLASLFLLAVVDMNAIDAIRSSGLRESFLGVPPKTLALMKVRAQESASS